MSAYHDTEWGTPQHDDAVLFEFLVLDSFQAGLSWSCILNKREGFRKAFEGFDAERVARFTESDITRLLADASIVRHRGKIEAVIANARGTLRLKEEFGTLDAYLWRFVDGAPKVNHWASMDQIPAQSAESEAMSKDLRKRGFRFVGPTICYAFMQGAGLVDDHLLACFRRR
jgi:DNA-3-methyladenine glycosylase I